MTITEPAVDRRQIEGEKARVYAPVEGTKDGVGWKELNHAIARVMQDYCGKYKNAFTLNSGLRLLRELRENEAATAVA